MKGITHFFVGVAAASCFPGVVAAGADGQPLYFILGGIFGILPDTLDFKVTRYFYRTDVTVTPDPLDPDPVMITDAIAWAVHEAVVGRRPVTIRLNTIRLGLDRWRRYRVGFNVAARKVTCELGPVVDTGGNPLGDGGAGATRPPAESALGVDVRLSYLAMTDVDIFDGPVLRFLPAGRQEVEVDFLPWHRAWTHSLVVGALFGLVGGLIWGWLAALVITTAYGAHAAVDQLGYMGSNLFAPLTRRRTCGLKLAHAGDAIPNFCAVWMAGAVIAYNLFRHGHPGVWTDPLRVLLLGVVLPCGLFVLLDRRARPPRPAPAAPAKRGRS